MSIFIKKVAGLDTTEAEAKLKAEEERARLEEELANAEEEEKQSSRSKQSLQEPVTPARRVTNNA